MDAALTLKSSPKNEIFFSILYRSAFEIMQLAKKQKKQKKNKQNNRKRKQKKSKYGTENFPLLSSGYILINNGNKTKWSPIRSVIIQNRTTESDFFISVEYDYGQNWTTPSPVNN